MCQIQFKYDPHLPAEKKPQSVNNSSHRSFLREEGGTAEKCREDPVRGQERRAGLKQPRSDFALHGKGKPVIRFFPAGQ